MYEQAQAYLDEALDYIQQNSVNRAKVDWPRLRRDCLGLAGAAQTTADTYPAIRLALKRLEDEHSFFHEPQTAQDMKAGVVTQSFGFVIVNPEAVIIQIGPGSPAEQAGLQVGDVIETINDTPLGFISTDQFRSHLRTPSIHLGIRRAEAGEVFTVRLEAAALEFTARPEGRWLEPATGYIDLPGFIGEGPKVQAYASKVQQIISELDRAGARGWILDLRRNQGGNMLPMLAGVGPLLGATRVGAFVYPDRREEAWIYRNGQFLIDQWVGATADPVYQIEHSHPPVAVLTSRLTASSGELALVAFRGRSRTRSFGEPTFGIPTSNEDKRLSDGAVLYLTTALGADRTGQNYSRSIPPDQFVTPDWALLGTEHDPVILAAIQWLHDQEN